MKHDSIRTQFLSLGFGVLLSQSGWAATPEQPDWTDPLSGIAFIEVAGGCFDMGHNEVVRLPAAEIPEGPRADESPQHRVCIDPFMLGTHEVTREQWYRVMQGAAPLADAALLPASTLSQAQIGAFIDKLNQQAGHESYRLPTEAEWEYACRAGTHDEGINFHTSERRERLRTEAVFEEPLRSDATTEPVGRKLPNAWGFYDMLGNVWELTQDQYLVDGYSQHSEHNPLIDQGGTKRALRGASYKSERFQVRCGARAFSIPDDPLPTVGFRLVKSLPKAGSQ